MGKVTLKRRLLNRREGVKREMCTGRGNRGSQTEWLQGWNKVNMVGGNAMKWVTDSGSRHSPMKEATLLPSHAQEN